MGNTLEIHGQRVRLLAGLGTVRRTPLALDGCAKYCSD
jgi:hypothetical protein